MTEVKGPPKVPWQPAVEVPIERLNFAPYNPRRMMRHEAEALQRSLTEYGPVEPAVVNADETIIGGHMRIAAARELGWETFPVVYVDLDDRKAKLLNLALNRISGEWDEEKLTELMWELHEDGGTRDVLDLSGFEVAEMEKMLDAAGGPEPEPAVPWEAPERAKPGEIWELAAQDGPPHRLAVGDSRDPELLARLLDGRSIDLVFSSPPYNVGMDYTAHDDKTVPWANYQAFLMAVLEVWLPHLASGRAVCWQLGDHPSVFAHRQLAMLEDEFGLNYLRTMVWDKVGIGVPLWYMTENEPAARRFTPDYQHELIYLLSKDSLEIGERLDRVDSAVAHSLVRVASATASRDVPDAGGERTRYRSLDRHAQKVHAAVYPVKLVQPFAHHLTAPGELVADPFLGVASTTLAAERAGRTSVGTELDPTYCDVALERYARAFEVEPVCVDRVDPKPKRKSKAKAAA